MLKETTVLLLAGSIVFPVTIVYQKPNHSRGMVAQRRSVAAPGMPPTAQTPAGIDLGPQARSKMILTVEIGSEKIESAKG